MSRREELLALGRRNLEDLADLALEREEENARLRRRVAELEGQAATNSRNSGKPPSSDGYAKPAPKSLRKKTGRKPGGQPGREGKTLQQVEKPDHTIVHRLDSCPCGKCGGVSLREEKLVDEARRQVFDLPVKLLEVTEHRAERKICPISGRLVQATFPEDVKATAQYGIRIKSVLTYLNTEHLLPFDRLKRLMEDIFSQPISEATTTKVNERVYRNLEVWENDLIKEIIAQPVVHLDESGVRVAGKLHWLHVASTAGLTFYGIHPRRGCEAMDEFDIIPNLQGYAVHDHWKSYFRYECLHALCNEHHLRELTFQVEQNGEKWAEELIEFLLRQKHQKAQRGIPSDDDISRILDEYHSILEKGRQKHPHAKKAGKQNKTANLLTRLEDYDECVLAFLGDEAVPFTNNQGEQDIRMIKLRQKISGGFRTLHGAQVFARVRGYISTCRKRGRNILEALEQALQNKPLLI
jgi:transposase